MNELEINYPSNEDAIALAQAEQKHIKKKRIRAEIEKNSGDTPSILGTTADATQLLLCAFFELITQLHTAKTLALSLIHI